MHLHELSLILDPLDWPAMQNREWFLIDEKNILVEVNELDFHIRTLIDLEFVVDITRFVFPLSINSFRSQAE